MMLIDGYVLFLYIHDQWLRRNPISLSVLSEFSYIPVATFSDQLMYGIIEVSLIICVDALLCSCWLMMLVWLDV